MTNADRKRMNSDTRAHRRAKLAKFKRDGVPCAVLQSVRDSTVCAFCRANHGKAFPVDQFPALPQPDCTDEAGCRSTLRPALTGCEHD